MRGLRGFWGFQGSNPEKIRSLLAACVSFGVKAKTAFDQPANPALTHLKRLCRGDHRD
jgi:hypothetical protein